MTPEIRPLVAGNWKMNGLAQSLCELKAIAEGISAMPAKVDTLICPPFTLLAAAATHCVSGRLKIGAQDCSMANAGAFTGDVSAVMLADCGASHVIVGHSERRLGRAETNADVRRKAEQCVAAGLTAIICVGETEEEMLAGQTLSVLADQIDASIPSIMNAATVVVAYEPIWAIGTGRTAKSEDIGKIHAFIREQLQRQFETEGTRTRILYGGSVKPENAREIMGISNVDGALVGGASLKAADFLAITGAAMHA